jgi:hypothetical protein
MNNVNNHISMSLSEALSSLYLDDRVTIKKGYGFGYLQIPSLSDEFLAIDCGLAPQPLTHHDAHGLIAQEKDERCDAIFISVSGKERTRSFDVPLRAIVYWLALYYPHKHVDLMSNALFNLPDENLEIWWQVNAQFHHKTGIKSSQTSHKLGA